MTSCSTGLLLFFQENQTNEVYIPGDAYDDVREILVHMYTPGGVDMSRKLSTYVFPCLLCADFVAI